MSDNFDPKKIIDFNKDYYFILGIDKDVLPKGNSRQDKINLSDVIEKAFRKKARTCHPDFGGSKEEFLDIVRARRILEDPYLKKTYDQGHFDEFEIEDGNLFQVDWDKIGNYRKGSPEDTIGFKLFLDICQIKNDLNIIPAFFPQSEEHNYEWDWVIVDKDAKLVLSLVHDENEVLRLTDSSQIDHILPFKIYICIPQNNLNLIRKNNNIVSPLGKTLINGQINQVNYNDYNLLETTSLEIANEYIKHKLYEDLENFRNNLLKPSANLETKWLTTEQMNKINNEQLSAILNMRTYINKNIEKADEFLNSLDDD